MKSTVLSANEFQDLLNQLYLTEDQLNSAIAKVGTEKEKIEAYVQRRSEMFYELHPSLAIVAKKAAVTAVLPFLGEAYEGIGNNREPLFSQAA